MMSTSGTLPSPSEALALMLSSIRPLPRESRAIETVTGRVIAERVLAERDQPPFDRVTMDGVAFTSAAWAQGRRRFRIAGVQAAGAAPLNLRSDEECLEAMTGAVLPKGCDCVVPVERLQVSDGWAQLDAELDVTPYLNVHARGFDGREGDLMLAPGTRLGAAELAVLASAGRGQVWVHRAPRVVVISTGDELIGPDLPIEPWQIRRTNTYGLRAALELRACGELADDHLPDDPGLMRERLATHLATRDVIVLTGGVSMGRFDFVPSTLRELGVREVLHRIAQRPGKPLWFGIGPQDQVVFGLPGNPVSSMVCLIRYVVPILAALQGTTLEAPRTYRVSTSTRALPALTHLLPVRLEHSETYGMMVVPNPTRGSGDFISLLGTAGFIELPPGSTDHPAGTLAAFYGW